MKKITILALALSASALFVSCKNDAPTSDIQQVETIEGLETLNLNTELSNINWKGYKVFKSENTSHFGTMKFTEGEVGIKDGQLVAGKFVADVNSLANESLADSPEMSEKLDAHLKDGDFFEVEKFPTATFEITKVSPTEDDDYNSILEGNLTIKETTQSVKFKANVKISENEVSIATEPTDIDRTLFGVKFQSPIENGVIKNEITLQVLVKAEVKK